MTLAMLCNNIECYNKNFIKKLNLYPLSYVSDKVIFKINKKKKQVEIIPITCTRLIDLHGLIKK